MIWLTMLGALSLASVHLFAVRLRFLDCTPRSIWLSAAGGISLAYVFLQLIPELAERQKNLLEKIDGVGSWLDFPIFALVLAGLLTFYGLERHATRSKRQRQKDDDVVSPAVFWIHATSFSIYNLLIGYLLSKREESPTALLLFCLAMALHLLVNDFGLREHYKELYHSVGRWLFAIALSLGWIASLVIDLPEYLISLTIAFIAGGVILNVLKEELPEERNSRFTALVAGAIAYGILLSTI